jgi:hypothetical protein
VIVVQRQKNNCLEAIKIKNCYRLFLVSFLFFLSVGSLLCSGNYVFAQTDQEYSKLQVANTAVEQAFNSVLEAEKVGANVTDLLAQLNVADSVLVQAENFYRMGDFAAAAIQAESVLQITQQVITAAYEAKQDAVVSGQNSFWYNIAFTVFGSFVFVLVLFVVWRWFKRRYINNLSQIKPEVNS